jgi:alpha,alpha-trehalose phosphorylase
MWFLERKDFLQNKLLVEESLFTIANGYIGIRGCFEEGYGIEDIKSIRGSYINGLYDRIPLTHAESAYGFPQVRDKQPRIIDTQTCEIYLDDEYVCLSSNQYSNYSRILDYKTGVYTRSYDYMTKGGKIAHIEFKRLASLIFKNNYINQISVVYDGRIRLISVVDAEIENFSDEHDPRVGKAHTKLMRCKAFSVESSRVTCLMETATTKLEQATVVDYRFVGQSQHTISHERLGDKVYTFIEGCQSIVLDKVCTFTDQLRSKSTMDFALECADIAKGMTFETFVNYQIERLNEFWDHSDIVIDGNDKHQSAIRFMLYQLLQSTGSDEFSNVSAKGLSGEGYEGHYFWDTEIYILPLLQLTQPEMARKLLEYRYHILPHAKTRALELGHLKGAAYPWRTISGIECSGYFPAGTAQYHINADIAYVFIQYFLFNEDYCFLLNTGAEVLYETARIWLQIGNYCGDVFMINSVTGPDEYTAVVNNNYYTNAMAKYHLYWAEVFYRKLSINDDATVVEAHKSLCKRIGLSESEVEAMGKASDAMFLPYDEHLNINPQDDSFLQKPIWPFENSEYPLLLHYHPLTIYRHQVLKQADTVLAHFLLEEYVDEEVLKNSYEYYEALTTHDSSLSACVHGIMASRIGNVEKAYHYFEESVNLDLEDTHNNTKDGLHMANIAGTALSVISGFGGFRIHENGIAFRPQCPKGWERFAFKVKYRGREILISISDVVDITLIEGDALSISLWDVKYTLKDKLKFSCSLRCLL